MWQPSADKAAQGGDEGGALWLPGGELAGWVGGVWGG